MSADEHNLDRGKLEIEVDLVAICARCKVQIVELKRLTNVIISVSSSNNNIWVFFLLAHYPNLGTYFLLSDEKIFCESDYVSASTAVTASSSFRPTDYSQ